MESLPTRPAGVCGSQPRRAGTLSRHSSLQQAVLPGVSKESSTTTKLRIVFDGSAITSSRSSLNDALLPGPSLYPLLTTILNKFRLHPIGMSADISKMFREVGLAPQERDLHRFLSEKKDKTLQDWRLTRITFPIPRIKCPAPGGQGPRTGLSTSCRRRKAVILRGQLSDRCHYSGGGNLST